MKKFLLALLAVSSVGALSACSDKTNGNGYDGLTFNVTFGNIARALTYQKDSPLTLGDGKTVVTQGDLKPTWQLMSQELGINFKDQTNTSERATDMIKTASVNGFATSNIYGGNSIAEDLQNYGQSGYFVNLNDYKDQMPNFQKFLQDNPDIEKAITTYTGDIYHIPYTAEIGEVARAFVIRESWVTALLDADDLEGHDTDTTVTSKYNNVNGTAARSSEPIKGTTITKQQHTNITELQAGTKNGKELVKILKDYIDTAYPGQYKNHSELFIGERAAYDADEMVALLRCVKANPTLLTGGKADSVTPLFVRQSDYRDDLLRMSTYFYGERPFGSDSYAAKFYVDGDENIIHSYSQGYMYDTATRLKEMQEEGLIFGDTFDTTKPDKDVYRTNLLGSDQQEAPTYGFMTYDWLNSTCSDSLNKTWLPTNLDGTAVEAPADGEETATLKKIGDVWHVLRTDMHSILPPVAEINGQWQYFIDNSRVIKPDGWAISTKASSEKQIADAVRLFDYIFSDEGNALMNYGFGADQGDNAMVYDLDENDPTTYVEIGGTKYYKFNDWVINTSNEVAKGDISTFLRDWVGSAVAVGFVKTIGGVAQTDSAAATSSWELILESTTNIPTYGGLDKNTNALPTGANPNYFKLAPPTFSMTKSQSDVVVQIEAASLTDEFNNALFAYMLGTIDSYSSGIYKDGYSSKENFIALWKSKDIERYVLQYQNAYNNVYKNN